MASMSLATRLFNSTRSNEYAINPPASTNSENGYIAGSFAAPVRFAMREWFVKTEGYLKILRAIADLDMFWVEIDSFNPEALGYIRRQNPHPISSCETLLRLREFLPYFREQAMDVAIIDTPWNGVWQSMEIASAAEACEVNVAPHNFYGHLCTMMNAISARGAEFADHGDRHRPAAVGSRAFQPRAGDRERSSDHA